jgi:hypothetical protein
VIILNSNKNGRLSEPDLVEFEGKLGVTLPADYREFLLEHNGGTPKPNMFFISDEEGYGIAKYLFSVHARPRYASLVWNWEASRGRVPATLLPIGGDPFGNLICISLGGDDKGAIYFWDHEREADEGEEPSFDNISFLADSFTTFIKNLMPDLEVEAKKDELEVACQTGNLDFIKEYLAAGGDVNKRNEYNHSLIQIAAAFDQKEVVRLLLENGACMKGALSRAAENGSTEVVEYLVSQRVDLEEIVDNRRDTPLMRAAALGHKDEVEVLLKHGANVNATNKYGQTAAVVASWGEHEDVIDLLKKAGAT